MEQQNPAVTPLCALSCPLREDETPEKSFPRELLLARVEENGLVSVPLTVKREAEE